MNSARSSTAAFTPFYLNYGCNPSPMIWKEEEVYPGVWEFAENMKDAIMGTHDAIIASRVQHTVQANKKGSQLHSRKEIWSTYPLRTSPCLREEPGNWH